MKLIYSATTYTAVTDYATYMYMACASVVRPARATRSTIDDQRWKEITSKRLDGNPKVKISARRSVLELSLVLRYTQYVEELRRFFGHIWLEMNSHDPQGFSDSVYRRMK